MNPPQKLVRLREQMAKHSVDAYIIPSADAHQSEYIAECDERRAFISGFKGSAGTAVVTSSEALLWTDGRYYLQATKQLEPTWKLMKLTDTHMLKYLANLGPNSRVGVDPMYFSSGDADGMREYLNNHNVQFTPITTNLVDAIWDDKPAAPKGTIFSLSEQLTGKSHLAKIDDVARAMDAERATLLIVSALDEIAWLFNLRGSDIQYNPVFWSFAVITRNNSQTAVYLFVDDSKFAPREAVFQHLTEKVHLKPYNTFIETLPELIRSVSTANVWVDKGSLNAAVMSTINELKPSAIITKQPPICLMKGLKNAVELQGIRNAHVRDAVALVKFFAWLEEELLQGNTSLTEYAVAEHLESLRKQQDKFVSLSFPTIAGFGANGAIIHYRPLQGSSATLNTSDMFLLDSGAQYMDGTTDVTRTVHFGTPTQHQKDCYTRVLKGHIALDTAIFPEGTSGGKLDILARAPLWKVGLNYNHGTGHGVGHFLNVHEGPHGIGSRASASTPLSIGMTVTNEPGYYEDGNFGIRIENVMFVKAAETPFNFDGVQYLGFEHVTWVPIQTKLINASLLTAEELEWINTYNARCQEILAPRLKDDDSAALAWLVTNTKPITAA